VIVAPGHRTTIRRGKKKKNRLATLTKKHEAGGFSASGEGLPVVGGKRGPMETEQRFCGPGTGRENKKRRPQSMFCEQGSAVNRKKYCLGGKENGGRTRHCHLNWGVFKIEKKPQKPPPRHPKREKMGRRFPTQP